MPVCAHGVRFDVSHRRGSRAAGAFIHQLLRCVFLFYNCVKMSLRLLQEDLSVAISPQLISIRAKLAERPGQDDRRCRRSGG